MAYFLVHLDLSLIFMFYLTLLSLHVYFEGFYRRKCFIAEGIYILWIFLKEFCILNMATSEDSVEFISLSPLHRFFF